MARIGPLGPLLEHRCRVPGRPSLTIYGAKSRGMALARTPRLGSRLIGRRLIDPERLHIAIAAEAEDGILVPVLPDADGRAIATVTNYVTLRITWATPIPPPDQSVILGIGKPDLVPIWDPTAGTWGRGKVCEPTLTFDHRIGDGAGAAAALHHIAGLLEHPERMG